MLAAGTVPDNALNLARTGVTSAAVTGAGEVVVAVGGTSLHLLLLVNLICI